MAETINLLTSPEIRKFGQQVVNNSEKSLVVEDNGLSLFRSAKRKSQAFA